jgi:hypothetical protein
VLGAEALGLAGRVIERPAEATAIFDFPDRRWTAAACSSTKIAAGHGDRGNRLIPGRGSTPAPSYLTFSRFLSTDLQSAFGKARRWIVARHLPKWQRSTSLCCSTSKDGFRKEIRLTQFRFELPSAATTALRTDWGSTLENALGKMLVAALKHFVGQPTDSRTSRAQEAVSKAHARIDGQARTTRSRETRSDGRLSPARLLKPGR